MPSFNDQTQDLGRKSNHDLNSSSVTDWIISNQHEHEQDTQSHTPTATTSPEKQPSQLGILILALATIYHSVWFGNQRVKYNCYWYLRNISSRGCSRLGV